MKAEALAKRRKSRALHSDDPLQILRLISSFLENTLMHEHYVCMRLHFSLGMLTNFIINCIQICNTLGNMSYNQVFPKAPLKNHKYNPINKAVKFNNFNVLKLLVNQRF